MTNPNEKRRLGLLTEILPAPTKPVTNGPRARTLNHLQKLLFAASAAALIEGCDSTTDPGYGVVDPMPPPGKCTPPFEGTGTGSIQNGTITVVLEAKNGSTLEAGEVTITPTTTFTNVLEGNKRTITFPTEASNNFWILRLPATCGGLAVQAVVQVTHNKSAGTVSVFINPP